MWSATNTNASSSHSLSEDLNHPTRFSVSTQEPALRCCDASHRKSRACVPRFSVHPKNASPIQPYPQPDLIRTHCKLSVSSSWLFTRISHPNLHSPPKAGSCQIAQGNYGYDFLSPRYLFVLLRVSTVDQRTVQYFATALSERYLRIYCTYMLKCHIK